MNINWETGMAQQRDFSGRFTITDVSQRMDKRNQPYSRLALSNESGDTVALAWEGRYSGPKDLRTGQMVNVTGEYLPNGGHRRCKTIVIVDEPRAEEMHQQAGRRLRMMNQSLASPALDEFIWSLVFMGPLAERFRTEPASRYHHHSYPRGLFIHSVDVALTMFEDRAIPRVDKPLAVMLGLAHDIGKAWLPEDGAVIRPGLDHDKIALFALGSTIAHMEGTWPDLMADLTQVMCLRTEHPTRRALSRRTDVLQEALQHADRLSCAESWREGSRGEPRMANDAFGAAA